MKRLLATVIFLNIVVLFLLTLDSIRGKDYSRVKEFQRLSSGFGLGASVNPRWGFNIFDPRIEQVEETSLHPVPGGYVYSPSRGMSISEFSENF
ncbi:MAG: hypothetical protein GXO97_08485 [Nitrospirae bacterium]|nr:hypothetical protein [Nitrospirota bacterium]